MTTYAYRCLECGDEFDRVVAMAERHQVCCPCGGEAKLLIRPKDMQVIIPRRFREPDEAITTADLELDV